MKIVYHIPPSADPDSIKTRIVVIENDRRLEPDGKIDANGGEFEYTPKDGSSGTMCCYYLDANNNTSRHQHPVEWSNAQAGEGILDLRAEGVKGPRGMRVAKGEKATEHDGKKVTKTEKVDLPLGLSLPKGKAEQHNKALQEDGAVKNDEPTEENTKPNTTP